MRTLSVTIAVVVYALPEFPISIERILSELFSDQLFLSASAPHAKYILVTTEVSLCQVELRTTWRKMSGQGPNELRTKFASSNTYEDFSYMLQYVHIKKMYLFLTYSSAIFPG